jgi:hypothetical protein
MRRKEEEREGERDGSGLVQNRSICLSCLVLFVVSKTEGFWNEKSPINTIHFRQNIRSSPLTPLKAVISPDQPCQYSTYDDSNSTPLPTSTVKDQLPSKHP